MVPESPRRHVGRRHVGHLLPLADLVERALAQSGVDGEDLAVDDVPDGSGLGGVATGDGDRDVDVHHLGRPGVGEVLRGGPDHRSLGRALECLDRGAEAAAAEEEVAAGRHARHDREHPPVRVVGGFEAEELPCIHVGRAT